MRIYPINMCLCTFHRKPDQINLHLCWSAGVYIAHSQCGKTTKCNYQFLLPVAPDSRVLCTRMDDERTKKKSVKLFEDTWKGRTNALCGNKRARESTTCGSSAFVVCAEYLCIPSDHHRSAYSSIYAIFVSENIGWCGKVFGLCYSTLWLNGNRNDGHWGRRIEFMDIWILFSNINK